MFIRNFLISTSLALVVSQSPLSDNVTVKNVAEAVKEDKLSIGEIEKRYTIYMGCSMWGSDFNFSDQTSGQAIFNKLRLVRDKLAPDSAGGQKTRAVIDSVLSKYKENVTLDDNSRNALIEDLNYIAEGFALGQ